MKVLVVPTDPRLMLSAQLVVADLEAAMLPAERETWLTSGWHDAAVARVYRALADLREEVRVAAGSPRAL